MEGKVGREARNQADWTCFLLGGCLLEFLVDSFQSHACRGDEKNKQGHWLTECLKQFCLLRSLVKTNPFCSVCLMVAASISASWNILVAPMGCGLAVGMHLPLWFLLLFFIFLLYYSSDLCVWKHQVRFQQRYDQRISFFPPHLSFFPSSSFNSSSLLEATAAAAWLTLNIFLVPGTVLSA